MSVDTLTSYLTVIGGFIVIGTVIDQLTKTYRSTTEFSNKEITYFEVLSVFYNSFYEKWTSQTLLDTK